MNDGPAKATPDTRNKNKEGKNMKIIIKIEIELNILPLEVAPVEPVATPVGETLTQSTLEAFIPATDGRKDRPHGWSPTYSQGRAIHTCSNCGAGHRRVDPALGVCKEKNCVLGVPSGPVGWV